MTVVRSPLAGQTRRGLALLVALALPLALLVPGIAGAEERKGLDRLTAEDNTGAAVAWSTHVYDEASDVLLGRDDSFADNLPSGLVQGVLDAPLLLTSSTALRAPVRAELDRLGAQTVHILGGTKAISPAVESSLRSEGYTVRRYSGASRIETAIAIARAHAASATSAILSRAFGTTGGDETGAWADALGAGAWAAEDAFPVLFSQSDTLTAATRTYLQGSSIRTVYVVGGTSAISEAVVSQIRALGLTVERVSGPNRFATAVEVAQERGFDDAGDATHVVLLEGQRSDAWAPGFAAAGFASNPKPVVLSNGNALPPESETFLAGGSSATAVTAGPYVTEGAATAVANKLGLLKEAVVTLDATSFANSGDITGKVTPMDDVQSVSLSGPCVTAGAVTPNASTGAFSKAIAQNFTPGECALTVTVTYKDNTTQQTPFTVTITGPAPNTPVLDSPELMNAAQSSSTTEHVVVRYTFDEPVTPNAFTDGFALIGYDGARYDPHHPDPLASSVRQDPADNKSVLVSFRKYAYERATTAVAEFGGVSDFQDLVNPEGSRGIQAVTFNAGRTIGPDLLSVSIPVAQQVNGQWLLRVTYNFARATDKVNHLLYKLRATTGIDIAEAFESGDGGTAHVLDFHFGDESTANTFRTNARRAVLEAGAARDAADDTVTNIAQTVAVSNAGNGIVGPTIMSVTLNPSANTVKLLFDSDAAVTEGVSTNFFLYDHAHTTIDSESVDEDDSDTSGKTVIVTFPPWSIDGQVTGVGMKNDAVTNGFLQTKAAGSSHTFASGATMAPDLLSVTRTSTSAPDPFGGSTVTDYRVVFKFNKKVTLNATDPHLYFAVYRPDGSLKEFETGQCVAGTGSSADAVLCDVPDDDADTFDAVKNAVLGGVAHQGVQATEADKTYWNYEASKVITAP